MTTTLAAGYQVDTCDTCQKPLFVLDEQKVTAPNQRWVYVWFVVATASCGTDGCVPYVLHRASKDDEVVGPVIVAHVEKQLSLFGGYNDVQAVRGA